MSVRLVVTGALCCFMLVASRTYLMVPITGILDTTFSYCVYPLLRLHQHTAQQWSEYCVERYEQQQMCTKWHTIVEENRALHEKVVALQAQLDLYGDIEELIAFRKRYATNSWYCAQIMYKRCTDREQYILVDQGSDAGIEVDMVAVHKNSLIGRVITVYPRYSKVILITDASCKVSVYCAKTKAEGIHQGTNNSVTTLQFVPHFAAIKKGDQLISSGQGVVFPRGFSLGHIAALHKGTVQYTITVTPDYAIDHINYCYLLKK